MAKILYYDLETAPNLSYVWGHYDQNVIEHEREWYLLCVSYRWEHEKKAQVVSLVDFPDAYKADPENDYHVAKTLWDLFNEADIVIAHNGDRFDMRKANSRFVFHGLGPSSPVQQIDTLKVARKYFMFNSNKLDDLGKHLGLGRKAPTGGFETWAGCMRGDSKAWKNMIKYAKQDVDLLVSVYKALRPWMTTHPNVSLYDNTDGCPTCGSDKIETVDYAYTLATVYDQLHCTDCGCWFKGDRVSKSNLVPTI